MSLPTFEPLPIKRINPEAAGAVAIVFEVPDSLKTRYDFKPGQFLTLRAKVQGQELRRNYSISSSHRRFAQHNEIEIGIRPIEGGLFSNWAAQSLKAGDHLDVMPPDGRFTIHRPRAMHRVGFAAGSGITPILSIIATSLEENPHAKFTLVLGNRRMNTVMYNEALQDLKDRFADRFTMIHVLSRQAQEVDLLQGRIDGEKVQAIIDALLPVGSMDEVFVCGPEGMIEATVKALEQAGVPSRNIHAERFATSSPQKTTAPQTPNNEAAPHGATGAAAQTALRIIVDGKSHELSLEPGMAVLDAALQAGLDIPYSCKAGVCCTCRGKLLEGEVTMTRNFTLQDDEVQRGFVLTCQAVSSSPRVVVSFDER